MKIWLCVLSAFLVAQSSFAGDIAGPDLLSDQALVLTPSETPVVNDFSGESVRLVGRGIINTQTHESIAVACVNELCSQIQFIQFKTDGSIESLGKVYEVNQDANARKAFLKHAYRAFSKQRNSKFQSKYGTLIFIGTTGAALGGLRLLFMSGIMATTGAAILVAPALGALFIATSGGFHFGDAAITEAFRDNQGWNWSSKPKRMGPKKYEQLVKYLGEANF